MKPLRDTMRREAGRIWREKASAEQFGLFMNEETLTETLLFHLARRFQGNSVRVHPFTKAQETRNGADWEFWFAQGQQAVGLRVQAKRLFPSGNYDSLNPNGQQTQNLIKRSGNCFPVFVFYNDERVYSCYTPECNCGDYRGPSYLGCTLTSAYIVSGLAHRNLTLLARECIPWHCLLCDRKSTKHTSLPAIVAASVNERFARTAASDVDLSRKCETVETPLQFRSHVEQMADKRDGRTVRRGGDFEEPAWLEEYLERRVLAGILLIAAKGDD